MNNEFSEKKHVLVVSGAPRVLAEIKKGLKDVFEINIAATSTAALAALDSYETSAIIINIGETRENAFSVFYEIEKNTNYKDIPVLFLAENANENDEIEAFDAGAVDYSLRNPGAITPLISRLNLRIRAAENEKLALYGENMQCPTPANPEKNLCDKTILVVDDVDLNRELIGGMLGSINGLTLDYAVDGEDAIGKYTLDPDKYSLILMDVQMPIMNGIDATRIIRGLNLTNARVIPIIALTADVKEEETNSYLEAGMNDFLKKPMEFDKLLAVVSKYIK